MMFFFFYLFFDSFYSTRERVEEHFGRMEGAVELWDFFHSPFQEGKKDNYFVLKPGLGTP